MRAWVALMATCLGLLACAEKAQEGGLSFQVAFEGDALLGRAVEVDATILRGGCTGTEVVYSARVTPDGEGFEPPELLWGNYGFSARARDAQCRWFADACVELEVPRKSDGAVKVSLAAAVPEMLDCAECSSAECGMDAGGGTGGSGGSSGAGGSSGMGGSSGTGGTGGVMDAGGDASMPDAIEITLEAEDGDPILAPLMSLDDAAASGGSYVMVPYDAQLTLEERQALKRADVPADGADGIATYEFTLSEGSTFRLWGRVITETIDDDSFYVSIDEEAWITWNEIPAGGAWHWADVRPHPSTDPYPIELGAGAHTIRISYREVGTKLDALRLTNDLEAIPEGL